jgi:hypothetical protein
MVRDRLSALGVPVRVGLPPYEPVGDPTDEPAGPPELCLWPLALLPASQTRGAAGREPLRLRVRLLVTADAAPDRIADLVDVALVALAGDGDLSVALEPFDAGLWQALGRAPRAAVFVDVPVQVTWPAPAIPLVRGPLRVDGAPLRALSGRLVGPGGVALAGMRVEVVGIGASAYTDRSGGFVFAGVPGEGALRLRLTGRGRRLEADVEPGSTDPVTIHCDLEEV